ncbi:hypothetical protein [Phyllobacterium zundukense]|uniref:Uncharacterized protein n=1 Tax=Phyllobacterium zundukense TaxID=1867719 RepID=A0A2N9W560_9HYPH|nr:hypothetical protein [Phyllobacterium zundukense]ATU94260.1 hypothetical protein BLM14_21090 [Phyllobacterium zundukense]PIO46878.1 hypothetical protein B5P45_00045 [Phyllobacterium zundukense]
MRRSYLNHIGPSKFLLGLFTTLVLLGIAAPVSAETTDGGLHRPMRIAIVREAEDKCEPLCTEWIYAFGTIEQRTPKLLAKFLKQLDGRRLPVIVESPGGETYAAMEMGRMIRAKQLDIAVGHTRFQKCAPDEKNCKPLWTDKIAYGGSSYPGKASCDSACVYLFVGGFARLRSDQNFMGVHMGTSARAKPDVEAYLGEMGIGSGLVPIIFSTKKLRDLTSEEMRDFSIVTDFGNSNDLTSAGLCKKEFPPDNCILRSSTN